MDLGERLSHAVDDVEGRESRIAELSSLITDLDGSGEGSAADRLEVKAVALSLLAELGSRPLGEAVDAVRLAGAEGRKSWPGLYLAHAALAAGNGELALKALSEVDTGYFEAEELHFRAVEARVLEAEACVLVADRPAVESLAAVLNAEYRAEVIPEGLYSLAGLARLILADPVFEQALVTLFDGLAIAEWVTPELVDHVAGAVDHARHRGTGPNAQQDGVAR